MLLALLGCGREETLELRQWTLHEIDGARSMEIPLTLPMHVDAYVPERRSTFALRTRVILPPSLRGTSLTLAIPFIEAPTSLRVDGVVAPSLEKSAVASARPSLASQSFHIDARQTAAGALELELLVERRFTRSAWLDTIPRISATPHGDRAFLFVAAIDSTVSVAAFAVISTIGFTYLALYSFDRKRKVHLWFALQAMGVAYYLLERLGIPGELLGLHYLSGWFVVMSAVAGAYFTHAYFGLKPPNKLFRVVPAVLLVCFVIWSGAFSGKIPIVLSTPIAFAFVAHQIRVLLRLYREGRDRFSAAMLLAAWGIVVLTCVPDVYYFVGNGQLLGGAHTMVFGLGTFSVFQAIVLGRDHAKLLRNADALNLELEARVSMLEVRDKENSQLNEELRRQIADKSRRLAEALARIGAIPERIASLAPGDTVQGRYKMIRRIGEGGMGAVYEIERLIDARRLALKVLTQATSGTALARLAREAQIAAEVSHENLVAIVDVDVSESGALYLVMELVTGAALHESRDRYGDVKWARSILRQIAAGLGAMHARGVVHRDLKPANVLLTSEGRAKIADFGIARLDAPTDTPDPMAKTLVDPTPADAALAKTEGASNGSSDPALTATGVLMGTPMYMAPELARGARSAAASSDIWSFGVIAYEITTGRFPFATPAVLDALAGRTVTAPPMKEIAETDDALVALVMLCLDPNPQARPTATEIEQRLAL